MTIKAPPPNLMTNDQDRLNVLAQMCTQRLDGLLENLQVDAFLSGNKYIGICPIHGDSDNAAALNIYYDGHSVPGYWKCRTKSCQNKFGKNIIGFTRGRLSSLKLGYHWQQNPKAIFNFPDTLKYLTDFTGIPLHKIKVDPKEQERRRFMAECVSANNEFLNDGATIHRSKVRKNLLLPAEYFVNRGYPEHILDMFDVGVAKIPKTETQNRIIVPIYNQKDLLVGYTCRSMFDKCPKCNLFHNPDLSCPILDSEKSLCSKWRHCGFNSEDHLYNYWEAAPHIKSTNTAVLVEGPGDVWRLRQHSVNNAVAMFGINFSEKHERLLANLQTMSIIVLTDNDSAGKHSMLEIKQKYGRLYRLYFPTIQEHDAGEMTSDAVTENIKPLIEKAMQSYHDNF